MKTMFNGTDLLSKYTFHRVLSSTGHITDFDKLILHKLDNGEVVLGLQTFLKLREAPSSSGER